MSAATRVAQTRRATSPQPDALDLVPRPASGASRARRASGLVPLLSLRRELLLRGLVLAWAGALLWFWLWLLAPDRGAWNGPRVVVTMLLLGGAAYSQQTASTDRDEAVATVDTTTFRVTDGVSPAVQARPVPGGTGDTSHSSTWPLALGAGLAVALGIGALRVARRRRAVASR